MSATPRAVVADDEPVLRDALVAALERAWPELRVVAACADGVDNDGDALLDYDQDGDGFLDRNGDPGCACNADASEGNDPVCFDGCDNDRDGLVDLADPGCDGTPQDGSEFNVPQCQDGIDNDRDGAIDFPFDDGCPAPTTGLETNPDPAPACNNGADDDGDGRIDYAGEAPDDGCGSAADTDEVGPCDRPQAELPANGRVQGNTNGLPDEHRPTCSPGSRAPEAVFAAFLPYRARVEVSTEDSTFDTKRAISSLAGGLAAEEERLGSLGAQDVEGRGGADGLRGAGRNIEAKADALHVDHHRVIGAGEDRACEGLDDVRAAVLVLVASDRQAPAVEEHLPHVTQSVRRALSGPRAEIVRPCRREGWAERRGGDKRTEACVVVAHGLAEVVGSGTAQAAGSA
jgi:hypothetical protein